MAVSAPTGIFSFLRVSTEASGSSLRSISPENQLLQGFLRANGVGDSSYPPPEIVRASQCAAASIFVHTRARSWRFPREAQGRWLLRLRVARHALRSSRQRWGDLDRGALRGGEIPDWPLHRQARSRIDLRCRGLDRGRAHLGERRRGRRPAMNPKTNAPAFLIEPRKGLRAAI